ncbi:hypothetical protein CRV09_02300 [Candidatus Pantoea edessiphila]|uniref:YqjK-like protein n=1 Tax=Candidatus Pantoea edessiphila TaxID=2044610 RepID=A0A2P5T1R8_9GAMM|nr:YqjK family protein [Candidatus Pantoea edessiphila]PPI88506.1 hypothetical protein CRV09_02300 [Candidatus Pantoea edessiphila]
MRYQQRKKALNLICSKISDQRLDLSNLKNELNIKTVNYDNCWFNFINIKKYLLIGSIVLAIWSIRIHKLKSLFRLVRLSLGFWKAYRAIISFLKLI